MKITIELSDAQVKGIKDYLKNVDDIPRPKKSDIQVVIDSFVHGGLSAPQEAVSDYINKYIQQ